MALIEDKMMKVTAAQKAAAAALTLNGGDEAMAPVTRVNLAVADDGKITVTATTAVGTLHFKVRPNLAELAIIMADGIKQADYAYTAFGRPAAEG